MTLSTLRRMNIGSSIAAAEATIRQVAHELASVPPDRPSVLASLERQRAELVARIASLEAELAGPDVVEASE